MFQLDKDTLMMILDNIPAGVCLTRYDGRVEFVNNTLCFYTGSAREQLIGDNINDMINRGQADCGVSTEVVKKKKTVTRYLNFRRPDGSNIRLFITTRPIFDADGNVMYGVALERDIENEISLYLNTDKTPQKSNSSKFQKEHVDLVYKSQVMENLISTLDQIAPTNVPVLIQGESGTGKEVIAKYIHNSSNRSNKKMICINCAEIPESLLESELFGYEGGAFTGASREGKKGLFDAAKGSTIFLDEINSLPLSLQPKLLRVLETNTIQRIGSTKRDYIDFRLIVATNENLEKCIEEGRFRLDLFYRINAFTVNIPPLRERREDIVPLANFFLQSTCRKYLCQKHFSDEVYESFLKQDWPGNVRELKTIVERLVLTSAPSVKVIRSIPPSIGSRSLLPAHQTSSFPAKPIPQWSKDVREKLNTAFYDETKSLEDNLSYYEEMILSEAKAKYHTSKKMAEALDVNQSTISRKLSKYNIL